MSTIWTFGQIENKQSYCGEVCIKIFCESLREQTKKQIMLALAKKELKAHQDATECYICRKAFIKTFGEDKNHQKVRDHCHYTAKYKGVTHNIYNLRLNVLNEISVVFHNGSDCYNHFIIKELTKELEGQFECLAENTEKYKTFSVLIEKEI